MLQVYPFYGDDVQEVYRQLNVFLAELAAVGVEVPLDCVHSNTKMYPDYGTTATTIEVAVIVETQTAYEVMPQVLEAQQRALARAEVPAAEAEEKQAAIATSDAFDPFLDSDDMP